MKKISVLMLSSLILLSINSNSYSYTPNKKSYMSSPTFKKINFNAYAPEDYDKNFQVGDIVLVPFEDSVKEMIIKEKLELSYVVYPKKFSFKDAERMSLINQYKFNSVYPHFDLSDFNSKTFKYKKFIVPHLKSYAKKFNLKEEQVMYFPDNNYYSILSVEDYKEQIKQLDELNTLLSSMQLPEDNYMNYTVNPIIWKEIASNAKEYMSLLLSNPDPGFQDLMKNYIKDIQKTKSQVENYNGSNYMFTGLSEWSWRAVSKNTRNNFYSKNQGFKRQVELAKLAGNSYDPFKEINEELDMLNISIQKNLSKLKIDPENFKFKDIESEKAMLSSLKSPKSLKIYKTGMKDKDWKVITNSFGVPLYKYKNGTMLVDDPKDDIKHCKTLYFNVQKDYVGGKYSSAKISNYHEILQTCP
jgi:hypothetical protein